MKQDQALAIMKMGYNVFLTGAAGSGKTHTLNTFIEHCRSHQIPVAVTASTGIAATHLNGMTIHSWAGIGIQDDLDDRQLKKLIEKPQLVKRFDNTKVLIVDEVSMLHGKRLDLVDKVLRTLRKSEKPFGGIQVILSGDLFQLPPVTKEGEVDWVFNSRSWQTMNLKICYLSEQHRSDDQNLIDILNAIRGNNVEETHFEQLQTRFTNDKKTDKQMTRLYTHNQNVDQINQKSIKSIKNPLKTFVMTSTGGQRLVEAMTASCLAPEVLGLKVGAEVMFVANSPSEGFYNGTRGQVVDFDDEDRPIIVTNEGRKIKPNIFTWKMQEGDKTKASISQYPLRLAWAITIHKSQGMSLDAAIVDLSKAFEPGMGYVALSRVRSLDGLHLLGANNQALAISPTIIELNHKLVSQSKSLVASLGSLSDQEVTDRHQRVIAALGMPATEDLEYDQNMFEQLKKWRQKQATKLSRPAYAVLPDKSLIEIAAYKPRSKEALLKISGVGPKKLEDFSSDILKITKS